MFVASEEATSGSVIANDERISPSRSGWSHCLRCWSEPNMASTSMLPVSGAAQLRAAGARCGLRPVISASGAYWRLVSPAPCFGAQLGQDGDLRPGPAVAKPGKLLLEYRF